MNAANNNIQKIGQKPTAPVVDRSPVDIQPGTTEQANSLKNNPQVQEFNDFKSFMDNMKQADLNLLLNDLDAAPFDNKLYSFGPDKFSNLAPDEIMVFDPRSSGMVRMKKSEVETFKKDVAEYKRSMLLAASGMDAETVADINGKIVDELKGQGVNSRYVEQLEKRYKGDFADAAKSDFASMSRNDLLKLYSKHPNIVGPLLQQFDNQAKLAKAKGIKFDAANTSSSVIKNQIADSIEEEVWGVKPIAIADNGKLPPKPFTPVSGNSGQSSFIDKNHFPKDLGKNRNNIA